MRTPEITEQTKTDTDLNLELFVSNDVEFFKGHFPDFQLLPGVVQVHWAVSYAEENFGPLGEFSKIEALKFTKPIRPESKIKLEIKRNTEKGNITFKYTDEESTYSSGRVYFT